MCIHHLQPLSYHRWSHRSLHDLFPTSQQDRYQNVTGSLMDQDGLEILILLLRTDGMLRWLMFYCVNTGLLSVYVYLRFIQPFHAHDAKAVL